MDYNNPAYRERDGITFTDIALKETVGKSAMASEDSALAGGRRIGSGIYFSYRQIGLIVGVVLLVVLIIALAAGVNHHMSREAVAGASLSNTAKDDPNLPWNKVNLPDNISPALYSIALTIDPTKSRFSGSAEITLNCTANTKFIVLHVNKLTLYEEQISVIQKDSKKKLKIVQQFTQEKLHYYVIEVTQNLQMGKDYVLKFEKFNGEISRSSTNGLFVSSYSNDKTGAAR